MKLVVRWAVSHRPDFNVIILNEKNPERQRHAAKVGRPVMGELKRLEIQPMGAGLLPDD